MKKLILTLSIGLLSLSVDKNNANAADLFSTFNQKDMQNIAAIMRFSNAQKNVLISRFMKFCGIFCNEAILTRGCLVGMMNSMIQRHLSENHIFPIRGNAHCVNVCPTNKFLEIMSGICDINCINNDVDAVVSFAINTISTKCIDRWNSHLPRYKKDHKTKIDVLIKYHQYEFLFSSTIYDGMGFLILPYGSLLKLADENDFILVSKVILNDDQFYHFLTSNNDLSIMRNSNQMLEIQAIYNIVDLLIRSVYNDQSGLLSLQQENQEFVLICFMTDGLAKSWPDGAEILTNQYS